MTSFAKINLVLVATLLAQSVGAQVVNVTFSPWTVMGPVNTSGTGYALLSNTSAGLDYEFHLVNVSGLNSIELHVGPQSEHGDVAAIFYKAAFANLSQTAEGRIAAGTLTEDDMLGPFLLPLGDHLATSFVYGSYITQGLSTIVVHTLGNPGGELGAYPFNGTMSMVMDDDPDSSMPMSAAPAPSMDMTMNMNMSTMGTSTSG